jgi:hypothetical protein
VLIDKCHDIVYAEKCHDIVYSSLKTSNEMGTGAQLIDHLGLSHEGGRHEEETTTRPRAGRQTLPARGSDLGHRQVAVPLASLGLSKIVRAATSHFAAALFSGLSRVLRSSLLPLALAPLLAVAKFILGFSFTATPLIASAILALALLLVVSILTFPLTPLTLVPITLPCWE